VPRRRNGINIPAPEATINAVNEITGPILAITLVLGSVPLPGAFLDGRRSASTCPA
jgi:multidrug efflux pump subunit AcrB